MVKESKTRPGKAKRIVLASLGLFGCLAIFTAVWAGSKSSERDGNGLCLSCHVMEQTVFQEFRKTTHFTNPSGVRAKCSSCHVPQELAPMIKRKVASVSEVIGWMRGTIDTPEKFDRNRLRLAKSVWADFKASDSRECKSCHNADAFDFASFKKPESVKTMKKGLEEGQTCIDCHKGIAHTMPDLSAGFRMMYEEISNDAKGANFKADAVYPVRVAACYMERDGAKAGRLLPLTRLEVLDTSGDWAKVRVRGWQQIGAERVICEMPGRRIFSAALSKKAVDSVKAGKPELDPDTGLSWRPAEFDCWIRTGDYLADIDRLNNYGSELHAATCGGCHAQTPAAHFKANQWIGGIKSMGTRVKLEKTNYRFLLKYLQLRASDVVDESHS
ncbi:NapC/NirT family cytochrome c [Pseudodesulfovibrio tunisiensis]|uniref:NapC/NirT family cytochrome c n=1 Tax=Pseudodesulfovibrio tunisiensis TaxID=463192 RepID=UPI001FB42603|nr:NapC/NirT family cytochrome c [Pseudodesulfovibrio tunisiensis]